MNAPNPFAVTDPRGLRRAAESEATVPALFAAAVACGEDTHRIAYGALRALANDLILLEEVLLNRTDLNPAILAECVHAMVGRAQVAAEVAQRVEDARGAKT